jgi:hypothetical protein
LDWRWAQTIFNMTNLLPPAAKKEIIVEYWTRVICAWVILWSVCLFIGVVLLWPTYVLLSGNNEAYADSVSAATERTTEYAELSKELIQSSQRAQQIVTFGARPRLSELAAAVLGVADGQAVTITDISLTRTDGELLPLRITGEAIDRLALAQARTDVLALPFVSAVSLPPDLAQNENITFSLTITIDNDQL